MLERISPVRQVQQSAQKKETRREGFDAVLRQELQKTAAQPSVEFSKHAMSRVEERGIQVTPDLMDRLAGTVERAQAKGATNILALGEQQGFIINVAHSRVITALSEEELKEAIFTNIDGAVIL